LYTGNRADLGIIKRSQEIVDNGVDAPVNIVIHQSEDFTPCRFDTDYQLVTFIGQRRSHDNDFVNIPPEWLDKLHNTALFRSTVAMMISRGLALSQRRMHSVKVDSVSIVGTIMLTSLRL
jgi:hypothetical protein